MCWPACDQKIYDACTCCVVFGMERIDPREQATQVGVSKSSQAHASKEDVCLLLQVVRCYRRNKTIEIGLSACRSKMVES